MSEVKRYDISAFGGMSMDECRDGAYVNYDEFLTKKYLPEHPEAPSYDELTYNGLDQDFNLNNLVCAYGSLKNPLGIYFSPQDAVFTANGAEETVSVDFVEDEMLYLTF